MIDASPSLGIQTSSSPKTPFAGLISLALVSIIGGLMIGAVAALVGQFLYLILLFPVGMGALGGFLLRKVIESTRFRNVFLAACSGLLMGVLIYGSMHATEYFMFRKEVKDVIRPELIDQFGETTPEMEELAVDFVLSEEVGYPGFVGYMLLNAREGVSISRVGSGSDGINLGQLTWGYWLIELCIIGGMAISGAKKAAARRYCETHQRWFQPASHLGGVEFGQKEPLIEAVKQNMYSNAAEMLRKESKLPSVEVYIEMCQLCDPGEGRLIFLKISRDYRGRITKKQIHQQDLSANQAYSLFYALRQIQTAETAPVLEEAGG